MWMLLEAKREYKAEDKRRSNYKDKPATKLIHQRRKAKQQKHMYCQHQTNQKHKNSSYTYGLVHETNTWFSPPFII
jgi:hypothetical protein